MSHVNVDYRKRVIEVKDMREEGYLIKCFGYEDVRAKDWVDLELKLEQLHEKERARLSYKRS